MIATNEITRPALRYYGGKFRLAAWIISYFPGHLAYVEPCGGAASVLLQKPRAQLETFNDLDGLVVNFWRVLRQNRDELIRQIRLTPWSRAEYDLSTVSCDDPMELARRFWISVQMSISASAGYHPGFRVIKSAEHIHSHPDLFDKDLEALNFAYRRFAGVQIENLDALDCIRKYDGPATLIYFDPPYLEETRTHARYNLEAGDSDFHARAADLLNTCQGYVVISGYASGLYSQLYEQAGWKRVDKRSQMNGGGQHRIESLWLSPRTVEAIQVNLAGLPMFEGLR